MWIIRITPYLFCNSIQDTINSVIVSRSCTHVLKQVKVMLVIESQKQPNYLFWKTKPNETLMVFVWIDYKKKKRKRKGLGICVCAQEYPKPKTWTCIYTHRKLGAQARCGLGFPIPHDRPPL